MAIWAGRGTTTSSRWVSSPRPTPTPRPPTVSQTDRPAMPGASSTRPSTIASPTVKSTTATPSLTRLSPSSATLSRSGVWSRRSEAKTETGSVAARMADSTIAAANGNPAASSRPRTTPALSTAPASPNKRIQGNSRRTAAARIEIAPGRLSIGCQRAVDDGVLQGGLHALDPGPGRPSGAGHQILSGQWRADGGDRLRIEPADPCFEVVDLLDVGIVTGPHVGAGQCQQTLQLVAGVAHQSPN